MVRALDDDGVELNAEFSVDTDGPYLKLVLESAGGRSIGSERSRNDEYVPALRLLLRRLGDRGAVLVSALLVSKTVAGLPEAERTILSGPLNLAEVTDYEELRLRLTRHQGDIGRPVGAIKPGNNRKRLQLRLDLPGYNTGEADRLAADLAAATTQVLPTPGRRRPARSSTDAWKQIQAICREAMSADRTIATIDKGIANRILDVRRNAIVRASGEARTPDGKGAQVTGTLLKRIWRALATDGHAGRIRGAPFFAYALVAEIPGVVVDDDRGGIHIADWDLAMTPFAESSEASTTPAPSYWTLASHPANYRVVDAVRDLDEDWWLTGGADIHAGDRLAIWKYKGPDVHRGIIAFGEVLTNPEVRDLSDDEQTYWIDPDPKASAPRVRVRYVIKPSEPLWLEDAPASSVIRQLPVSRAKGGTAHHVTPDQWQRLVALAGGWPSPDAGEPSIPAFEYVAFGELDGYVREFADASPELKAALSAGRLPFPPTLVERSRNIARIAARIWAVTSTDSPAYRELFEINGQLPDNPLPAAPPSPTPEDAPERSVPPGEHPRRSNSQAQGARLENGMLKIFERLFRIEDGDWQAETGGSRRSRAQVRRQQSGTQYGADIVVRFKGAAIGASSTCLVECKNYAATASRPTVSTVADKLLQAQDNFDAEPVDHWILISPNLDPNNELDRMVERWNATQLFPFTVQIWSPQTGIRELFTIDPDIYRSLYGEDPPESGRDMADILAEFSERLRPPLRLSERLRRYIQDPISFVEPSKREWLDQLTTQIERFGFDEKGAGLGRPLEAEILSVLVWRVVSCFTV